MKSQIYGAAALLIAALTLDGCTGLEQFPSTSTDYVGDLGKLDPDYRKALDEIKQAAGNPEQQKLLRDLEIDRRLRVIDLNFSEFRKGLAKEKVAADFGVAVVQVGVGAAGALVAETVSQILSAASGGLAGAQQAYSKAALYDQTLSALLAQMIASQRAVLVKIYEGRAQGIDVYPLSAAVKDLEAYEFAGSLPGAVIATSADAKVKIDQADKELKRLVVGIVPVVLQARREQAAAFVKRLDAAAQDRLATELGVPTGTGALVNILRVISAAETDEAFNGFAEKVKELFNQEL